MLDSGNPTDILWVFKPIPKWYIPSLVLSRVSEPPPKHEWIHVACHIYAVYHVYSVSSSGEEVNEGEFVWQNHCIILFKCGTLLLRVMNIVNRLYWITFLPSFCHSYHFSSFEYMIHRSFRTLVKAELLFKLVTHTEKEGFHCYKILAFRLSDSEQDNKHNAVLLWQYSILLTGVTSLLYF